MKKGQAMFLKKNRHQEINLDIIFWNNLRYRNQKYVLRKIKDNYGNPVYLWILANFMQNGRVVDTLRVFSLKDIAKFIDEIELSAFARKKWNRMLEVYGDERKH